MNSVPILNIYFMLCYAWGRVQDRDPARLAAIGRLTTVHDLLAKVLASGTNQLLRRGIERGYVERREDLAGIRGKVAISETAMRALRARGRVACDFEELSADFLPNRILRSTLRLLLQADIELATENRSEVRSAYMRLNGISPIRLDRHLFGQVSPGSNRRLYGFLLSICRLVYDSAVTTEESGDASFYDFRRDQTTMWKLFEEFVTGFYQREQSAFRVNSGGRGIRWAGAWANDDTSWSFIPKMFADVILESNSRRIILDTKFYKDALAGGRNQGKLNSGNLYQLLAYLRNRQRRSPHGPRHEGILLYPETSGPMRIDVRLESYRIQAQTVNLNRPWPDIHRELLSTICA